jgi:ATP-dependent exoDNAse (exonuclease V) beta subunit
MAWKSMAGRSLLLAPINATRETTEPLYQHVRAQLRAAEDTEAGRLLYVAATRAKERLHLLGCLKRDKEGFEKPPGKRSLLALLWPLMPEDARVVASDAEPPESTQHAQADRAQAGAPRRLPIDWQPAALPPRAVWPAWLDAPVAMGGEAIEFSWAGETARHIGSVVHRWLQRIAETGLDSWDAARIAAMQAGLRMELSALGVEPAALEAAAARVADALTHSISDERGRWLLGPQREARNEYRLSTLVQGRPRHFVIDRSFTDAQGRRWIIDYKTSRHEGGDMEDFLDREQQRYRGQLEAYALVLPRDPAETLRFGLYFPLLGGWREWGPNE